MQLLFPTSTLALVVFILSDVTCFDLHFPDKEHFFIILLAICASCLRMFLFISSLPTFWWIWGFFFFTSTLYILDVKTLLDRWWTHTILSQSMWYFSGHYFFSHAKPFKFCLITFISISVCLINRVMDDTCSVMDGSAYVFLNTYGISYL